MIGIDTLYAGMIPCMQPIYITYDYLYDTCHCMLCGLLKPSEGWTIRILGGGAGFSQQQFQASIAMKKKNEKKNQKQWHISDHLKINNNVTHAGKFLCLYLYAN